MRPPRWKRDHVASGLPAAPDRELAREFVWGGQFPEPVALIDYTAMGEKAAGEAEVFHYVRDELGSVAALTDAGHPEAEPPVLPAVVERYEYDPYGRTYIEDAAGGRHSGSQYGNPFMWTGQRYDPRVKLYGFPARAYSPELGRWLWLAGIALRCRRICVTFWPEAMPQGASGGTPSGNYLTTGQSWAIQV